MSVDIILFHPGPYQPGQTIEGKVVCVFSSSTDIRGIRLKLKGKEHTHWEKEETVTDDDTKHTKWTTIEYSGDNTFLEFQENLIGQGTQNPGRYEYPYRFILPRNLPGTYGSPNGGHIRYYLKANVDIPMAPDYEDEKLFTVMPVIDLNEIQNLPLNPIELQDEKTICCWCCADGPITLDAYLERGAFVLGEIIKLRIEVENNSNESVEQMKVKLKNVVEERVNSPSSDNKDTESVIVSELDSGVGAHGKRTYNFNLQIPSNIELPNFSTCTLFKQYCELEIEASLPGPHTNMRVEQKVILGHIPPRTSSFPPAQQNYPSGDMVSYPSLPNPATSYPGGPGWVMPSSGSTPYVDTNTPSAPTKADLAAGYNPPGHHTGPSIELPPPSYNDIAG